MRALYFTFGYILLQFGVVTFLTNPFDSMFLTILCFLVVLACYCLVSPFIRGQLQELTHFDKFVSEIYQSNRRHPLSEKFGTAVSEHMPKKEQYSSDQKKDIGAYVATDLHLDLITFSIAITPGLLLSQFL